MRIYKNVRISNLSWIKRGGVISNYYEPESLNEFIELVKQLNRDNRQFIIVGHTSNIYFKNTYNTENLISTKRLNKWKESDDEIDCECGTNVHLLAMQMVDKGVCGFEGLIDLPGTVGAAIYGNSGCYDCLLTDILKRVDVILSDGNIKSYSKEDICFSHRNSDFKSGVINGAIISVILHKVRGDKEKLAVIAENNHRNRVETQPSPKNNLGSIYCNLGYCKKTLFGSLVSKFLAVCCVVLKRAGLTNSQIEKFSLRFQLILTGYSSVYPYLYNINRFIWKDEKADEFFVLYQKFINRLYKNPELEIEIME